MAVGKIDQMSIKYSQIFHGKTFQKLPKFGFLVLKIYHLATLKSSAGPRAVFSRRQALIRVHTSLLTADIQVRSLHLKCYQTD
jgi:hypothetical protein